MIDKVKSFIVSLVSKKVLAYVATSGSIATMPGLEPNVRAGLEALLTVIFLLAQSYLDGKKAVK